MADGNQGSWSPATFLKAWNDYIAASQAICERLKDPSVAAPASTPLPLFEAWHDFAKSLGMTFATDAGAPGKLDDFIVQLSPALGWGREYQSTVQRMLELGEEFQRRYAEFVKQGADINERALEAARRRIADDPQLASSPSRAYEVWIDSAEAVYAQAAHTEAFSRSLGELCNLCGAFKVERGKLLDALARHLDLPSRAEVNSLHRQIRELNAAVRAAVSEPSSAQRKSRSSRKPKSQ